MLSNSAINNAIKTAIILNKNNLKLIPETNTPLQNLCTASFDSNTVNNSHLLEQKLLKVNDSEEILANNLSFLSSNDLHTDTLKQSSAFISSAVLAHLNIFKNTIKPLIIEFCEKLNENFNSTSELPFTYDISVIDFNDVLNDEELTEEINQNYLTKELHLSPCKLSNENKTSVEILELMFTGDKTLDSKISLWYNTLSPDFFRGVWDRYFSKIDSSPMELMTEKFDPLCDNHLAIYLIARKIQNNSEPNLGISSADYKKACIDLMQTSATYIKLAKEKYQSMVKNNIVILGYSLYPTRVKVIKENYDKFLDDGGKPEVILGACRNQNTDFTIDKLKENAEKYSNVWNSFLGLARVRNDNIKLNTFKRCVEGVFNSLLNDLTEVEKKLCLNNNYESHLNKCFKLLESELDCLNFNDLDNISLTATRIMTRCRFYFTDSEKFLFTFEEYANRVNPKDIKEAATVATGIYIADYLIDQFRIVNKSNMYR